MEEHFGSSEEKYKRFIYEKNYLKNKQIRNEESLRKDHGEKQLYQELILPEYGVERDFYPEHLLRKKQRRDRQSLLRKRLFPRGGDAEAE